MPTIELIDPEAAGLDAMIAGLLEAAAAQPAKAAVLDRMRGTVTISVPDAEVAVGLVFCEGGVCRVHGGALPQAWVRLRMPSDLLLSMALIPLLFGLPSLRAPEGRAFVRRALGGEVKISGWRHLRLLRQLGTVLSLT